MPKSNGPSDDYKSLKRYFAKKLQMAMLEKGWNQSTTARRAAQFMPDKKFGRDAISKYLMLGKSGTMPSPIQLAALAKALNMEPEDLLPTEKGRLLSQPMNDGLSIQQVDEDTMHIRINQRFPIEVGKKIAALVIRGDK